MIQKINKNKITVLLLSGLIILTTVLTSTAAGNQRVGKVAERVTALVNSNTEFQPVNVFSLSAVQKKEVLSQSLKSYSLIQINASALNVLLNQSPNHIRVSVPSSNGTVLNLLLYKTDISKNGFTIETSDGQRLTELNKIVHYRGIIENDPYSIVGLSFSNEEIVGIISNIYGNNVLGKIENTNADEYVFYNDQNILAPFNFSCGANTLNMVQEYKSNVQNNNAPTVLSTKCVDWYYEIDYDIFVGKGSLANVNSYIQGVFNQVSTLYDNDGISITLQTLYVWTATDPYTGPSTSNYLNQFGAYRTSFVGDLANLIGYAGGGGVAYVNGLCSSSNSYKMGYSGIGSTFNTVPTYSWTVEVITHEDGHLLGSRHTHDCVWNGNSTAIDGCGDAAGYPGNGSCADGPIPVDGTIMSYCHLISAGINFSLGFGPQPTALMLNNVNNANCLSACSSCQTPSQPGTISGASSFCQSSSQTYSVTAVAGATGYTWTLPAGWSGTSTTNSITVSTTSTGGTMSVSANNSCGSSTARTLTVSSNASPQTPGNLSGSTSVCQGTSQTYSVSTVPGATSYIWSLPSGWTGTSTINSIVVTTGASGGVVSVVAVNSCGNSSARTSSVSVTPIPSQPATISGSSSACPGAAQTYSVTAVSGAVSYTWTLPSGWSGSSATNSINVTAGSSGGNITVIANNSCGSSNTRTLAVSISGNAPATPGGISATGGNTKVCPGTTKTYSISAVSGATSYTWNTPTGATILSGQGTNSVNVEYQSGFTAGGVLSVVSNNSCGSSASRNLTITRNSPVKPGVVTGNLNGVCSTNNVGYSVNNTSGITYNWYFSTGTATVASGQGSNSILANFNPNYVTGTLNVTASNACGTSAPRTASIKATPPAATTMTGTASPCANQSGVPYSITPVPGATSYTWTVPSGSRINDGTITSTTATLVTTATSVTVNFMTTAGNVRVNANNACGTGASKTIIVAFSCREATSVDGEAFVVSTFPNPVKDIIQIEFNSRAEQPNSVRIMDVTGKTIMVNEGNSSEGLNTILLDVNKFTSGIYFLEVINGGERSISKISKE